MGKYLSEIKSTPRRYEYEFTNLPRKVVKPRGARLAVEYPQAYPPAPIRISDHVVIVDPERFVVKAISDLEDYVVAVNNGKKSWLGRFYLVDELIEKLAVCGVTATVTGADLTEPALRPLKLKSKIKIHFEPGTGIDDPDEEREQRPRPKRGLNTAEIEKLFADMGIDRADRTGLPENILTWLERMDKIQARTKALRGN